jgi:catechol 2,3-dioxygenase-like lactoylglutathione lyase family enzyme
MRIFAVTGIACALIAITVSGQAPQPAPGSAPPSSTTVGFMHAIHATNQVDKTLAFYTDVFGVGGKVQAFPNEAVPILTDSPGVTLRVSMLNLPGNGFNFELTEFSNVPRTPAQPNISDPGAPHMKVLVRDIEPVVAAVKRLNAPILTTSKAPVAVKTGLGDTKAIFFRDPDGYIVEAIQVAPPADAPASGNVVGSIMGLTVSSLDTASKFWHDMLGFEMKTGGAFSSDKAMQDLMGIGKGGSFSTVMTMVPGSRARIEFIEFKGVPGKPFSLRVPDPGASGMAIRVANIQELLPKLKANGVRVISRNGELVNWSPTVRNVFVKDPGGLNIELVGNVAAGR